MADTRQAVLWCLEFRCPLRTPEAETNPGKALGQLSKARYFSKSQKERGRGFDFHSDICVTAHTFAETGKGKFDPRYPSNGFLISKEFAFHDGPEEMLALCAACPANATPDRCGGCAGTLMQFPESKETEAQIQGTLSRLNLSEEYSTHFLMTQPLWYGLWAKSPIATSAIKMLRTIFSQMLLEDQNEPELQRKDPRLATHLRELAEFIRATEIAEQHGFKLHVTLPPLGHTDFGFYTVFPHCPRCKAAARIKHWQRKYPTAPYTCDACGQVYSPAETASSECMEMDEINLREMLGQAEFEKFAVKYLIAEGIEAQEASSIVTATENAERQRKQKFQERVAAQNHRLEFLKKLVREELCQGLTVHGGDSEDAEEEIWPPKFNAADFAEYVRRCQEKGLEFHSVTHESKDGDKDRHLFQAQTKNIKETLDVWISEGCEGLFYGNFLFRPNP